LHIEWRTPATYKAQGQRRGNSGVIFQDLFELQILDSYDNKTYVNGQAGSIYLQHIPLVNASKKPGEWQTYDVMFTAARFNPDSTVLSLPCITVLHNGVLIQNNVEIKGKNPPAKGPLRLQEHIDDYPSFRNIWIREL
jgi:hypothetical protein